MVCVIWRAILPNAHCPLLLWYSLSPVSNVKYYHGTLYLYSYAVSAEDRPVYYHAGPLHSVPQCPRRARVAFAICLFLSCD